MHVATISFWETYLRLGGFAYLTVAIFLLLRSIGDIPEIVKKSNAPLAVDVLGLIFGAAIYFFTWPLWLIKANLDMQKAAEALVNDRKIE